MTRASQVLHAASRLRQRFVGSGGYGVVYGSHPAGTAGATSDLDLVFISAETLLVEQLTELVNAVRQLHHEHGLDLDTEVDYAVKLHATCDDVTAAVTLSCFEVCDGTIEVPPVVVEPWFLNSEPFRLRLLLSALTSAHAFLGGNVALYDAHRRLAERAVALLALSLRRETVITLGNAIVAVTHASDGAIGKDYLGHTAGAHLVSVMHNGLARLAAEGIVKDLDGTCFEPDPAALRAAITIRSTQSVDRTRPGWQTRDNGSDDQGGLCQ